ncbi:MAG: hypothetical protein MHMPM18_005195 [Marteilia pararefringens]
MALSEYNFNLLQSGLISSDSQIVEILCHFGVVNEDKCCPNCNDLLNINKDCSKLNKCRYFCKICKKRFEVSSLTKFKGTKIPLIKIMQCISLFVREMNLEEAADKTGVSKKSMVMIHSSIREAIFQHVESTTGMIGNNGPVENDETVIARRKYNRGRVVPLQWLFGGIEREGGRFFLKTVPKRDSETLGAEIKNFIVEGSTVYSDQWGAYQKFFRQNPEYSHSTVNHSREFVNGNNPSIHTQNIEGLWSLLKRFMRRRGLNRRSNIEKYLAEFVFRKTYSAKSQCEMFKLIVNLLF